MKLSSHQRKARCGRESSAIALGLFVLSLCLAALLFKWSVLESESEKKKERFEFATPGIEASTIRTWHHVDQFPAAIAQIDTVFWEPDDTSTLRAWLLKNNRLRNAQVLEVGCGTGLVAITCALNGAKHIVATDINPAAVVNAIYNAELCGVTPQIEVRQVNEDHPGPFEVVSADEKFKFIISNPPWEDAVVTSPAAYAFYDPKFMLLDHLLRQSQEHLQTGGSLLLAYGCKTAIQRILTTAPDLGWEIEMHDTRRLDDLPEVFLPGMLLELKPK
jgi:release factor glutamine methyltransferase